MNEKLNELKKTVFYEFLDIVGRVFVIARYSENLAIGNRGLTKDEMENGIVLVFNNRMNFMWDDYGISATLVFGTSPQKCFIPVDDIAAIYSPELNAQFMSAPQALEQDKGQEELGEIKKTEAEEESENIVRVDFNKKKKRKLR